MLQARDLRVSFHTPDGWLQAVRGLDFTVAPGQTLGIVGESGSGKSVAMLATLGLSGGRVGGEVLLDGEDLVRAPARRLRQVRGAEIAMIFQDPLSCLHPHYRVGWQIVEAIRAHERVSRAEATGRAAELLAKVGIAQARQRLRAYPHEFSGGMRQRVMIAMALALRPRVLIADEPTTALDVTVQAQILALIRELQEEYGMAVVLITHDLGVVAQTVDDAVVMYAGKAVEHAPRRTLFHRAHHPYTRGLLRSLPGAGARLEPIHGRPPSMLRPPTACPFHPRCPFVFDRCLAEEPPPRAVYDAAHHSACWLPANQLGASDQADRARAEHARRYRHDPAVAQLLTERDGRPEGVA